MSAVLEIHVNREARRAQVFRARFHAALGDNQPLEAIPTDDLSAALGKLQTRARQGDPNGWAWVHAQLAEAELIRRDQRPGKAAVETLSTPCGNASQAHPHGILGGNRSGHSNGAANTGAALATAESRKGIRTNG